MDTNDAHPSTLHSDAHIERAAIIRLIKAHAADCERLGARQLGHGYLALVSEIEDAMQHDIAHVEALEGKPAPLPDASWVKQGARFTSQERGVFRGRVHMVWTCAVEFVSLATGEAHELSLPEFCRRYRPL